MKVATSKNRKKNKNMTVAATSQAISNHFSSVIGSLPEFNQSPQASWENYKLKLKYFFEANEIISAERKRAVLMSVIGEGTISVLLSLIAPKVIEDFTFDEIILKLSNHFSPVPNEIVACFKFSNRNQLEGESISDFIVALRKMSRYCNYKDLDKQLMIRLICGVSDTKLQHKLLAEPKLTLEKAVNVAIAFETANKNVSDIRATNPAEKIIENKIDKSQQESIGKIEATKKVNYYQKDFKDRNYKQKNEKEDYYKPSARKVIECFRCGGDHKAPECLHMNATCNFCKKKGHLKRMCRALQNKNKEKNKYLNSTLACSEIKEHRVNISPTKAQEYALYNLEGDEVLKPYKVKVKLNGKEHLFEVDSGAAMSVMSEHTFYTIWPNLSQRPVLRKSKINLFLWGKKEVQIQGQITITVQCNNKLANLDLLIVSEGGVSLLGRNWFKPFGIQIQGLYSIEAHNGVNQIIQEFEELFQGRKLSALKVPPVKIEIERDSNPIFLRARPVPISIKDRVNQALERMIEDGTFEPTDFASWATPVVPVLKQDGSIRLCIDYRSTVNAKVKKNAYPLPTVQEMLTTISGGTLFTQLDLNQAYYQLPVDSEAAEILTINTSKGLLKVNRLPQGLSASPGIFQKFMETLIIGIPGVVVFIDDVLISGKGEQEHNERLCQVLTRMRKVGMSLNKDKCNFAVNELEFLGFIVSSEGIKPSPSKVKAIHNAPNPTNKGELQAFLGLLNFYVCFLKDKASVAEPLHRLLDKDRPWAFGEKEKRAFQECKLLLQSEDVLAHYDPGKRLILTCDASAYGVGAILALIDDEGRERPIAYGSRTLSRAERNYGQVDKEGLAIIFGVKKFEKFLLGREFTIFTDHKPLLGIFKQDKPIPQTLSPRMLRWSLTLAAYSYNLQYRRGKDLGNADGLSRLPEGDRTIEAADPPEPADVFFLEFEDSPYSAKEIAEGTQQDPILATVKNWIVNGKTGEKEKDQGFQAYVSRFNELSVVKNCVLWQNRVIVPQIFREPILKELHLHHPGIVAMKSLARCYIWWPGMDNEIEEYVKKCTKCQETRHAEPLLRNSFWARPSRKWSRLHIDYLGPMNGKCFLIVVDAFSKWLEVVPTPTMISSVVINSLRNIFATHGIPEYIVSDNATNFTSSEFLVFMKENGIKHIYSPPYHPSSNGQAERSVQTVKDALRKMDWKKLDVELPRFLLMQRNTPKRATGQSPSEIMFGKRVRTSFDNLHPERSVEDESRNWINHRIFKIGEPVWERKKDGKWFPTIIVSRQGNMMYKVNSEDGNLVSRHVDQLRLRKIETPTLTHKAEMEELECSEECKKREEFNSVVEDLGKSDFVSSGSGIEQIGDTGHGKEELVDKHTTYTDREEKGGMINLEDDVDQRIKGVEEGKKKIRPVREKKSPIRFKDYVKL